MAFWKICAFEVYLGISLHTVNDPHENVDVMITLLYELLSLFWSLPHTPHPHMLWRDFDRAQAVQSPAPSLFLRFSPPSHLITLDKCPYWLHVFRCSRGSLRLYHYAHIAHIWSPFCIGGTFYSARFKWVRGSVCGTASWDRFCQLREVLVNGMDTSSTVTVDQDADA